jgi:pantoate--beta-alanine ligase
MNTLRSIAEVRRALEPFRGGANGVPGAAAALGPSADGAAPRAVGLVPTMGAFHAGHVALFRAARLESACVVASLFVNPAQFGDPADLATYPRDEARDTRIATEAGVDYLFIPSTEEIYPPGYATWIEMDGAARGLEGDFRPGHFRGVATICLKLLTIVRPHLAFFGQKDAQQVAAIKQLVRDLDLELEIRVVPTVREVDGLAMSSRNVRLSPQERERALAIPRALDAGLAAQRAGADPIAAARSMLTGIDTEYVAVADFDGHPTLVIAARVGTTRLIDNVPLDRPGLQIAPQPEEVRYV